MKSKGIILRAAEAVAGKAGLRPAAGLLREDHRLLRAVIDNSAAVIYIKDLDGRFILINRRFGELFGIRPELAVGKTDHDLFPKEMADVYRANDLRVLAEGRTVEFEEVAPQENGTHIYISIKTPLFCEDGRPCAVYGISTDITGRKRAEEERLSHLRFLEDLERVDRAIRTADDLGEMMMAVLDASLSIFGSDRAWLLYPCDPDAPSWSIPMERTREGYPGAYEAKVVMLRSPESGKIFKAALSSGEPLTFDPKSRRPLVPDIDKLFSIRSQILTAIHPKRGKPWLFGMHQCSHARIWTDEEVVLFKEIGRRVADGLSSLLLLEDLREGEAVLGSTLASMDDCVYVLDKDCTLRWSFQPHGKECFDPSEGLAGRAVGECLPPHAAAAFEDAVREVMEDGAVRQFDYGIEAGGGTRWFSAKASPRRDASGRPAGVTIVARDSTERVNKDRELKAKVEEMERFFKMTLGRELRIVELKEEVELLKKELSRCRRSA